MLRAVRICGVLNVQFACEWVQPVKHSVVISYMNTLDGQTFSLFVLLKVAIRARVSMLLMK